MRTLENQCRLFSRWLYFFAGYTLVIKYVLPVAWAAVRHEPLAAYIYFWDAWWIAHLAVGWGLSARKGGVWIWALLLALAEIIIIVTKFILYWRDPIFDFWRINWFFNKCGLLALFSIMLVWLLNGRTREGLK